MSCRLSDNIRKCGCGEDKQTAYVHSCPYQSAVNGDHQTKCTCCEDCANECAQDI